MMADEIKKYVQPLPQLKLFEEALSAVYKSRTRNQREHIQALKVPLEDCNAMLSKARDLLLGEDIEPDDLSHSQTKAYIDTNSKSHS